MDERKPGHQWNPRWKCWMKSRLPVHSLPMQEIASRYLAGETTRQIAEDYKSALAGSPKPEEVIRRRLKRMGVVRRPRGWQNQRGPKNQQWKGGHQQTMHLHRRQAYEIVAICLGRPVEAKVVIHHVDEDPTHNCPENLMVFPNLRKHSHYHQQLLRRQRAGTPVDAIQLAIEIGAQQLRRPISLFGWKPDISRQCLCDVLGKLIGVHPMSGESLQAALRREYHELKS